MQNNSVLKCQKEELQIQLYIPPEAQNGTDLIYVVMLDGSFVFRQLEQILTLPMRCHMVFIGIDANWRLDDYTPWPAAALNDRYPDFGGKGDAHLKLLMDQVIPQVIADYQLKMNYENTCLIGYSLGGLLVLNSLKQYSMMKHLISLSGSFWYPDWLTRLSQMQIKNKTAKIYLLCGSSEGVYETDLKNNMLAHTRETYQLLKHHHQMADVRLEWVAGGHHDELGRRYQKVLQWLLEQFFSS